jgi:hypothetical protein
MKAIYSSETSVDFQRTTRCYIPEDRTLYTYNHRSESLNACRKTVNSAFPAVFPILNAINFSSTRITLICLWCCVRLWWHSTPIVPCMCWLQVVLFLATDECQQQSLCVTCRHVRNKCSFRRAPWDPESLVESLNIKTEPISLPVRGIYIYFFRSGLWFILYPFFFSFSKLVLLFAKNYILSFHSFVIYLLSFLK